MDRVLISAMVAVALAWPAAARGGVRGDLGWSADGRAWGLCNAWILPDSPSGCRFFDRESRVWVEIGRREAIALWRPWEPELEPLGTRPLIPVYPMQEQEDNPGPVRLSGRLIPSDDVVELWRLEGDVSHGDRGGEWTTIFDYSSDGLWLAVGAVHVDHETSLNEFFVEVRPVSEWLALAHSRVAIDRLASGRIRAGISSLARARHHLEEAEGNPGAATPKPSSSPLAGTRYVDDDMHSMTFARWSRDGRTLCVCESWREQGEPSRTRCRTIAPPGDEWRPVVVSLIQHHCPGYGHPPPGPPEPPALHVAADGGYDGETAGVSVYLSGGELGTQLGAVLERSWEEPLANRDRYPAFFHEVGLMSPGGKWLALGFLREERGPVEQLTYDVEVRTVREWIEMAAAEIELHARSEPPTMQSARPRLELPGEESGEPEVEERVEEGGSGCSLVIP
jgi:hypothetical protein